MVFKGARGLCHVNHTGQDDRGGSVSMAEGLATTCRELAVAMVRELDHHNSYSRT